MRGDSERESEKLGVSATDISIGHSARLWKPTFKILAQILAVMVRAHRRRAVYDWDTPPT